MKKIVKIISIITILALSLLACNNNKEGSEQQQDEKTHYEETKDENLENESEKDNSSSGEETEEEMIEDEEDEKDEELETKTDIGRFIGFADSTSVEIEISGVTDGLSARNYAVSEEISNKIEELNISEYDEVLFKYYFDEEIQRDLIVHIEKK
ncbi:MAG: hypothetical protein ACLFMO_06205 [Eubacteriales bacterium]